MSIGKIILSLAIFVLIGCANNASDSTSNPPSIEVVPPAGATATAPAATPPTAEPAQNADGVWHYTCAKGCAGGGGSAVACATCGETLAHNQGYHAKANAAPASGSPLITNTGAAAAGNPTITPPPTAEPPQNAAGVWHFTCSKGCAGGGGSAVACSGCGTTLVHNQGYH